MKAEKIFRNRADYDYKVIVTLVVGSSNFPVWRLEVHKRAKGSRSWERLDCSFDPEFMELGIEDKDKYSKAFILTHIPAFWVREVQGQIIQRISKAIV